MRRAASSTLPAPGGARTVPAIMSTWKKIRYKLEWLGLQWLYFVIPLLPRKAAHLLGKGLGSLAYLADKRGRTTAIENLTLIFGAERDTRDIRLLARASY